MVRLTKEQIKSLGHRQYSAERAFSSDEDVKETRRRLEEETKDDFQFYRRAALGSYLSAQSCWLD